MYEVAIDRGEIFQIRKRKTSEKNKVNQEQKRLIRQGFVLLQITWEKNGKLITCGVSTGEDSKREKEKDRVQILKLHFWTAGVVMH